MVNSEKLQERLREQFANPSAFYRDTCLHDDVLEKYQEGIIFQDPTFCDATFKRCGLLAPHRYLVISSNARSLGAISANPQWGLCVWQPGCYFKVLDKTSIGKYTQVTLLEVPEDLLPYFQADGLTPHEDDFASRAIRDIQEAVNLPPLEELNTKDWLDRLADPLGINDDAEFFNRLV